MSSKKHTRQGNMNPDKFKAQRDIRPIPSEGQEYCRQYFINLMLTGYTLVAPPELGGGVMTAFNIDKALEAWK